MFQFKTCIKFRKKYTYCPSTVLLVTTFLTYSFDYLPTKITRCIGHYSKHPFSEWTGNHCIGQEQSAWLKFECSHQLHVLMCSGLSYPTYTIFQVVEWKYVHFLMEISQGTFLLGIFWRFFSCILLCTEKMNISVLEKLTDFFFGEKLIQK